MTKKRLADLLREEAQQSPELETEAIQEAPGEPLEPLTLSETEPTDETTADPSPINLSVAPRANKRLGPPTKADLETTVAELREALQSAHGRENSLQQQLDTLQLELQEQKRLVQNLQAAVEQAEQIKVEYERAKEVILKLTEANSKKSPEVNLARQEDQGFKSQKSELKKIPYHSIRQSAPSTKLSNADVGWVD
jgi:predicted RNase H-like nuclease (RuvC/YqgF family)